MSQENPTKRNRKKLISNRTVFLLISTVTALLLIGSIVAQRIVFRAEGTTGSEESGATPLTTPSEPQANPSSPTSEPPASAPASTSPSTSQSTAPSTSTEPTSAADYTTPRLGLFEPLLGLNRALFFFSFLEPTEATVRYGKTAELGQEVKIVQAAKESTLELSNLESASRYYYQTVLTEQKNHAQILSQIKSFQTPIESSAEPVKARSELRVEPTPTTTSSQVVFVILRDQSGNVITNKVPIVSVDQPKLVTIGQTQQIAGISETLISSTENKENKVKATIKLPSGEILGERVLVMGVRISAASLDEETFTPVVDQTPPTKDIRLLLWLGAIMLVALGVIFFRLARLK